MADIEDSLRISDYEDVLEDGVRDVAAVEDESAEDVVADEESAPWPCAGTRVMVGVEDLQHILRLGDRGTCEGTAPDEASMSLVRFDAANALSLVRIPKTLLVPEPPMKKWSTMRMWDKATDELKRGLLLSTGVSDPLVEALRGTTSERLTLWSEFLRSYGLSGITEAKLRIVQPAFLSACSDFETLFEDVHAAKCTVDESVLEKAEKMQKSREAMLRRWWASSEMLMVLACDDESKSCAMWCVRKEPLSVRYYEAGAAVNEGLRKQLSVIVELVGKGAFEGLLRTNAHISGNKDELLAHYVESEMREVIGEGRGCIGRPAAERMRKLSGWLKGLMNNLETFHKKWRRNEELREAKRQQLTEAITMRSFADEERRKVFEARWNEVLERQKASLDEGSFEGKIIPIGLRPPVPKVRKAACEEPSEFHEKSFLHLEGVKPDEEDKPSGEEVELEDDKRAAEEGDVGAVGPEIAPVAAEGGAVEGGASGSADVAPPEDDKIPEVPAPLPPPPAAPVRMTMKEYEALEDVFMTTAALEDLRSEDKKFYENVRSRDAWVCSRCHFKYGCSECDPEKAWSFACRSTLWHRTSEAVRPNAKPKGRPKRRA